MIHTFAGNPLDRADAQRRDPDWLAARAVDPESRYLVMHKLNVPLVAGEATELVWLPGDQVTALGLTEPPVLLGLRDGRAWFAADASDLADPSEIGFDAHVELRDARAAAMQLATADTGIVAQARSQIDWHRRHRFCSVCGAPSAAGRGGHVRHCDACGADHFPRTDPVVIMVIVDGNRCLLGQSAGRMVSMGLYSALAGFVDQGESIEEAVRREVREEAGVGVGEVRYHSSQPWPFPSSLMIGCHGRATSTEINIDPEEMADVSWFEREEVLETLRGGEGRPKQLPGPIAIAHHLIISWANGEVDL